MSGCRGEVEGDDGTPRVFVRCVDEREPEWIGSVERGIEEEGVPWVVQTGFDGDPVAVAYEAALESSLKIGVSVSAGSGVVIHHKQLPDDDPLFVVNEVTPAVARRLGSNSARLAKGTPLKPVN